MPNIRSKGLALVLLSTLVAGASAQSPAPLIVPSYEVTPVENYVGEYRDKHRSILEAIEKLPSSTPVEERSAIYEDEIGKLKSAFLVARRAEYESRTYMRTIRHVCRNHSQPRRDCGYRCAVSPSEDLQVVPGSIRRFGRVYGSYSNERQACFRTMRVGFGRSTGGLHVTFKFKPHSIARRLEEDAAKLFETIGQHDPART